MFELGTGIYTLADAARLLGEPPGRLRGWASRYWEGNGYGKLGGELTLDFTTLIELKTFAQLRAMNVATRQIRAAAEELERLTGHRAPFAHQDILTNIAADGARVFWRFKGRYITLDGTRQFALRIIQDFVRHLDFDAAGQAQVYRPATGEGAVVLDARRRFGQPVIRGTNIEVAVLCRMHESGDSVGLIAAEYELSELTVSRSLAFCAAA